MYMCLGYAWSGGGKRIVRVDVSSDKGKSWHVADLEQTNDNNSRHWSWTLWSILLPVPESNKVPMLYIIVFYRFLHYNAYLKKFPQLI